MATWFDRQGGVNSGRVAPSGFTQVGGDRAFVLGSDGDTELATLTDGDYTELRQVVDLTDIDIVKATLDTVGVAMSTRTELGLQTESDTLFRFNMDKNFLGAHNNIPLGFDLDGVAPIAVGTETYSTEATACRVIPVGSATAQLQGVNTPQAITPDPLANYTFDVWLKFDADSHVASTGIHPIIFECDTVGTGGLTIFLTGVGGGHTWYMSAQHKIPAGATTMTWPTYPITTDTGWKMFTIVHLGAGVNAALYVDGAAPAYPSSIVAPVVNAPAAAETVLMADPLLYGAIDQVRLSNTAHSLAKITSDYNDCIAGGTAFSYTWQMQFLIDGQVVNERTIAAAEARRFIDWAVPVRNLDTGGGWGAITGNHEVAFRLKLEQV